MEVEVIMSYLGETRTAKFFKRGDEITSSYRWPPMDFTDNQGDATFRYGEYNTTNNATGVYPEWQHRSLLGGFYEVIPVILGSGGSNSSFNFYTCGDGYTGLTNAQYACSFRFYNRATNTTAPGVQQMFCKAFALKKDLGITGFVYQVSGTTSTTVNPANGGIFMIPIADNR